MHLKVETGVPCPIVIRISKELQLRQVGKGHFIVIGHFLTSIDDIVIIGIQPESSGSGTLKFHFGKGDPFHISVGEIRNGKGEDRVFNCSHGVVAGSGQVIYRSHINGHGRCRVAVVRTIINEILEGGVGSPRSMGVRIKFKFGQIRDQDHIIILQLGFGTTDGSIAITVEPESSSRSSIEFDLNQGIIFHIEIDEIRSLEDEGGVLRGSYGFAW